jgi:hypothetical protein
MIKKLLYGIILLSFWYLALVFMVQWAVNSWITNSESTWVIIQEEEKYYLPEETMNSLCVQFIIKWIDHKKWFYDSVIENSNKLWLDYRLVLSAILWEQIRISCKWVRWDLKNIIINWTPKLLRSYNVSVGIAWIKLNTAFRVKQDAKKYWYEFDDIITEERLTTNDVLSAKVATYLVKNIITRWQLSGYDISNEAWIVGTLYNMWNAPKKNPHKDPEIGWAIININWHKYAYGEISLGIFNYLTQ